MDSLKTLLKPLAEDGAQLTREQARDVLRQILSGQAPEVETAALLTVLATRGEQAPELAGFVDVMREQSVPVPLTDEERAELVDCVGTGGGGPLTFNISCGAALVAAAAGAKVAKHGNRAVTSLCGAADVLEALGVPIDLTPELAVECLRETGFVFLYAPLYHPAMKTLGPLRRALGFRTTLNLCGPLTKPAHARIQVVGVLAPSRVLLVGRALQALGSKRAFVVHGSDGIDELTTTGESVVARIIESEPGVEPTIKAARITPEMAGLPRAELTDFIGGDVEMNKTLLYDVLTGIKGARRDIVLLNAAAMLVAADLAGALGHVPLDADGERIPAYAFPENAARALARIATYAEWRAQPPGLLWGFEDVHAEEARDICRSAVEARGETWLTDEEMRRVLNAFALPMSASAVAHTADDAAALGAVLGFPVVAKVLSSKVQHKTEIGGVRLNLQNEAAVRRAFNDILARAKQAGVLDAVDGVLIQPMLTGGVETMIGVAADRLFGPLIGFGLGGIHVELLGDVRFRIAPLTDHDADELMHEIRGFRLLEGYRGQPAADVGALRDVLLRVSRLADEVPEIIELDLNPVIALPDGHGCRIVDARIKVGRG